MKKYKKAVTVLCAVLLILAAAVVFLWVRFGQRAGRYQRTDEAMGTDVQQTVYGTKAESAASAAVTDIGLLNDRISWKTESSDIARLNAAAGTDWISVDPKTVQLLNLSLEVAEKSGGAFDPAILPLSSLWDFGGNNQHVPSKAEIAKYLPYVDYRYLRVDTAHSLASLRNHFTGVSLDALAAGAACDEAVSAYRTAGAECGIVSVRDAVGTYGAKSDGSDWSVAVRDPSSGEGTASAMGEIRLTSGFLSTCGIHEQSFRQNGVLYHSLLNPKTGYPQNNGLVSVTVEADGGALSSALANACFVLGMEKSRSLLTAYHAGAVLIDSRNRVFVAGDLKDRFRITDSRYVLQP